MRRVIAVLCVIGAVGCGDTIEGVDYDSLEISSAQCQDDLDNDGDGATDCDDSDCQGFVFCADDGTTDADTDTDTDTDADAVCNADNEGEQRCELNVVETCTAGEWVAKSDCTATGLLCGLNEAGTTATCGTETALCDGLAEQAFICLEDFMVMCNAPDGHPTFQRAGDYLYRDCTDYFSAIDPMAGPGGCFDYADVATGEGAWGADCLLPQGRSCAYVIEGVGLIRLGCGDNGEQDPNQACDEALGCAPLTPGACDESGIVCDGNSFVLCGAPYLYASAFNVGANVTFTCDAPEYGSGICDPTGFQGTEPVCVHETVGGPCLEGFVQCGGSLTCNTTTNLCE